MTNLSNNELSQEYAQSLVDSVVYEEFIIHLSDAWQWLGYPSQDDAKRALGLNFTQKYDYHSRAIADGNGGIIPGSHSITLTIDCFKSLAMIAGNDIAKTSRRYFIEAEKIAKNRPVSPHHIILKALYDTAIDKCLGYYHAEFAMNHAKNGLPDMSETTALIAMLRTKEALEKERHDSLHHEQCEAIIKKQFQLTLIERKDSDANLPQYQPFTYKDLEDIEFVYHA